MNPRHGPDPRGVRGRLITGIGRLLSSAPVGWLPRLGCLGAALLAPLLRRRWHITRRNISICFPELDSRAQRRLVRASMASAMTAIFENALAWYGTPTRIGPIAEVHGLDQLRKALSDGRGALLLATHQLPMELGARILSERLGMGLDTLARRHGSPWLEATVSQGRSRFIDRLLDKKDLRGVVRALRDNRVVVLIGDQDFNVHHVFAPFFGVPAATLAITPRLARLSAAPVLPVWAWRQAPGRYVVEIEAPLAAVADASPEAEARRYMAALEERVRARPEQYLWQHRRFKTRPPGEPDFY